MSTPAAIQKTSDIRAFLFAGDAIFTLLSNKTGTRYTFRVKASKPNAKYPKVTYFVGLLVGPDNLHDYETIGKLDPNGDFLAWKNFASAPAVKAFVWFLTQMFSRKDLPAALGFYHLGRCGRCRRALTTPESVERGLGPECAGKAS